MAGAAAVVLVVSVAAVVLASRIRSPGRADGPTAAPSVAVSPVPSTLVSSGGAASPGGVPGMSIRQTSDPGLPASPAPATASARAPGTPKPSPSARSTPGLDHTAAGPAPAGGFDILANRLVDFDTQPPDVTVYNPQVDIPDTIDVRVGPDNLYPPNGAENWFKQSGTCASERASRGLGGELVLKKELTGKPGTPIAVCLYTTSGRYLTLWISTGNADGGGDPYRFTVAAE